MYVQKHASANKENIKKNVYTIHVRCPPLYS